MAPLHLPIPHNVHAVALFARRLWLAGVLLAVGALPHALAAQSANGTGAAATPVRPALAGRRSADGRREVLAVPVRGTLRIDGALDDATWTSAEPATDFVQAEPRGGELASERTEVRVAFDDDFLYVAAYLHDHEPDRLIINDIRKDFGEQEQDDFEVLLDTFGDRRNGYIFITNLAGARSDRQVANEGREVNASWDAVWRVETRRVADGWTTEMAIPFRALRFARDSARMWGINFSRRIRRKNEVVFWSPVPRSYNLMRVSLAGNLAGLETRRAGRDLRLKPYVAANTVREVDGTRFDRHADAGIDAKYGLTAGLTLDATFRSDFAQAEADEQQVNLTQFSQFFPEKRDFFLENSGVFYVGDAARNNKVNPSPTPDEDLLLFFSRRIGLTAAGDPIPIDGGVRLTGTAGGFRMGGLTMQTRRDGAIPANNYSVFRLRRDVFSGSDIGLLYMQRQATDSSGSYNRVYGVNATFRFLRKLDWASYAIRSSTPGAAYQKGDYAARTSLNWEGNFFHGKGGVMSIGEGFRDDLGFLRRTGVRKYLADAGVRPRPAVLQRHGIRELHPHITWDYYTDQSNQMVAKRLHNGFSLFFTGGAFVEFSYNPVFQHLTAPFAINPRIDRIPTGDYGWNEWMLKGNTDLSRPISAAYTLIAGGLWSGDQRTVQTTVTVRPSYRFRFTVGGQYTDAALDAPDAHFVASLLTTRANYSFTPNMFVDALSQYDPQERQFSANVRFNLIHHPLSDLFIVYNDQRFLTVDAPVAGRSVIVKFTQMFAF